MAGYVKIWTQLTDDPKFLALSMNERSGLLQLMVEAKKQRDNGCIFTRNMSALSQSWACEVRTAYKVLVKLQEMGWCSFEKHPDNTVEITLHNYKEFQEIDTKEMIRRNRISPVKLQPLRPDQTRPDHICQNDKKEGELEPQELIDLFNKILTPPLNKVQILRPQSKRLKTIQTRLKEHPDKKFWEHIYKVVSGSNFLCGLRGGWKADFNWLLNSNRLEEIYEGKYDNNPIMTAQEESQHYKRKTE